MATLLADPAKMIEQGALHLIRTEAQLEAYTSTLFQLTSLERPSSSQLEAIELLTLLVERYEQEHYKLPKTAPAAILRFLLEQHGLKKRDIASELGEKASSQRFSPESANSMPARFNV